MPRDDTYSDSDTPALSQFQKNRFFKGKLMTPRDMEAEQAYHAERLHTINRFLNGKGIVHGIEIQSVTETDDGLDVTLTPGLALDGNGRPIVVEQVTTKSVPMPADDEVYFFLEFTEAAMETIPVPDTEGAVDDDTAPNRAVESFTLTYHETEPDEVAAVPDVDIPNLQVDNFDPQTLREALSEQYQQYQSSRGSSGPAVFVGAFERTPDGNWVPIDDAPARPVVFDSEYLFGVLVDHVADTDNPHRTPVTKEPMDVPEDVDEIMDALEGLQAQVETLQDDRRSLTRYVMRKTIKDRIRFFEELADRVQEQSGEASQIARSIVDRSRENLQAVRVREEDYEKQLDNLIAPLVELGDCLEPVTTEESLEDYLRAVSNLQSAVEEDRSLLDQVDAHDEVCEAADSLEVLLDVVPVTNK
ncbi:hypothetical protein C499_00590 [Halogeometricum borinquense DSM 11551]|uniref:Uncharacterized protein n=2 Tax=Halogeometricum borinquense TaxID=60847 RepID=E4NVX5_HALBP|nr:hypothetical protein [Halogeometricum borinquense]ADQ69195.1 hypothetical protein Hbor_38810 [Halogeometricum borinquense DSM 11551]ELY31610.1 hypothetical protein C499_00590 [Halogeometricum borinquense DSM 11551]RYJ07747.1 hypothetical protein ELS19_20200 [Halogeometricum borinquense]